MSQRIEHHFDKNCLTNLNLFFKSDYSGLNGDDFSVRHWSVHCDLFIGSGKVGTTMALNRRPNAWSDIADVIKIDFALWMLSILLGPIGPGAVGEVGGGGGKRGLTASFSNF